MFLRLEQNRMADSGEKWIGLELSRKRNKSENRRKNDKEKLYFSACKFYRACDGSSLIA